MFPAVFLLASIIILRIAPWLGGKEAVDAFAGYTPLMGYALCGGAFLSRRLASWFPVAAIIITHGVINVLCYENRPFIQLNGTYAVAMAAVSIAAVIIVSSVGVAVKKKASLPLLIGTVSASTVLFYLTSNTVSFFTDPRYQFSVGGWFQALTTGHPQFMPTWVFLLRGLAGDIVFTALFYAACRKALPAPGTVPAADADATPALAA